MDAVTHDHRNCDLVQIQLKADKLVDFGTQEFKFTAYKCEKITLDLIKGFLAGKGIYNYEIYNKVERPIMPNCDLRDLIIEEYEEYNVKLKIFVLNLVVHLNKANHWIFGALRKQHEHCVDERNQPAKKYKVVFVHDTEYHFDLCACEKGPSVANIVGCLRQLPNFANCVISLSNNMRPFPLPQNLLLSTYLKRSSLDGVTKFSIVIDSRSNVLP